MTPSWKEEQSESWACYVTFKELSPEQSQAHYRERYRGPPVDRQSKYPSLGYPNQDQRCQASERLLTLAGESAGSIFEPSSSPHTLARSGSAPRIHRFTLLTHSGPIWASLIFFLLFWIISVKFGLNRCFIEYVLIGQGVSETRPWDVHIVRGSELRYAARAG
jgi:hypothetical protein